MKRGIFFSLLCALVFSCSKEELAISNEEIQLEDVNEKKVTGCSPSYYEDMYVYMDFPAVLNCRSDHGLLTDCRYLSCNSETYTNVTIGSHYADGFEYDYLADPIQINHSYSPSEAADLMSQVKDIVRDFCGENAVIISADFNTDLLDYWYLFANIVVCSDPVFNPKGCKHSLRDS